MKCARASRVRAADAPQALSSCARQAAFAVLLMTLFMAQPSFAQKLYLTSH